MERVGRLWTGGLPWGASDGSAMDWLGDGFSSACSLFLCIADPDCLECNNSVFDSCPQTAMKLVCQQNPLVGVSLFFGQCPGAARKASCREVLLCC